jgi:hypothetical protein
MEQHRIEDKSNDKKYYVMLPRMVFYKSTSPYDLALYFAIKDIAGEEGECMISTPDLARFAMMSSGQVCKSRNFLIDQGVLEGEVRRDPGYQQPVWHLRIPDIWQENIAWCKEHSSLKSRLEYRVNQELSHSESSKTEGENQTLTNELSPGEKGTTPGEKGTTYSEKGTTPGETKNILLEESKEKPKEHMGACAPEPSIIKNPRAFAALQAFEQNRGQVDYSGFPEDVREMIRVFCELWNLRPPVSKGRRGGEQSLWIGEARELLDACGEFGFKALQKASEDWHRLDFDKRFTVARPGSVTRFARAKAGELRGKPGKVVKSFDQMKLEWEYRYPGESFTQNDYQAYLNTQGVR